MPFKPNNNGEVYCYLKHTLEPRFRVIAEPSADYYSEWQYCYRILDDQSLLFEMKGDFRETPAGDLANQATKIVQQLMSRLPTSS